MSALATRLLVLGVVRIFEPANAYQLRRELLSWNVEQWANINPGSVYGMLSSLDRAGLVDRHVLTGVNGRPVGVYTVTADGSLEFTALVHRGIRDLDDWADVSDLRAALAFMPFLSRGEVSEAIADRLGRLEGAHAEMVRMAEANADIAPPHVVEAFGLEQRLAVAQLEWLRAFADRIAAGALSFAGESGDGWEPAPDDPGNAMVRDRERYLRQLDGA